MTATLEERIGRQLTAAETHIDIDAIDKLLNSAKDALDKEISAEQQRLGRTLAQGRGDRLRVTEGMRRILAKLVDEGRAHARRELRSMGIHLRRFAAGPDPRDRRPVRSPSLQDLEAELDRRLRHLTVKINRDALGGDITAIAATAIERAVTKILGARAIAADLVAPTFVSGLSDTFEQHLDLVEAWQYTAVLDAGLCEECAPHDGETYDTLAALFDVLPGFGPNPSCLGGDRCRCRAVPVPPRD